MSGEVEQLVREIDGLDLEGLRALWQRRYGPPPPLRSVPLLRLLLAWRVQAEALGGLDADTRRALLRKGSVRAEGLNLGIGACLTREWQGRAYRVVVEPSGFSCDGRSYPSLSAVATAIAGSRWNGPRFFGLRDAA